MRVYHIDTKDFFVASRHCEPGRVKQSSEIGDVFLDCFVPRNDGIDY